MDKKYFFIITLFIIIGFVLFFFPKENNVWGDSFTAKMQNQDFIKNKNCTCIGFTKIKYGLSKSDIQIALCYGVPISCKYNCKKIIKNQWNDISCTQINQ